MRAFVTGGTGFIGSALVRALRARGSEVTVLARSPEKVPPGITAVPGDIVLKPTVADAIGGHDVVFHLAAWYAIGARDRARMERINVTGTQNVLTAARDAGVTKIVYCSTVAALGREKPGAIGDESTPHEGKSFGSIYEESKYRAHEIARSLANDGAPIVSVMPGATYGPGDHSVVGLLLSLYARRILVACPFQDTGLSWVHVDDVAAGMIAAAEKGTPGDSFILGGDNATIGEMFRRISPFTGIRPPWNLPDGVLRAVVPLSPGIARLVGQEPNVLREGLASLHGSWMFSSARAEDGLGYEWRGIEDGIVETVRTLRTR
ncbi:MAG: NAD-dependent epimerase/dehydratase family protein [Actinomycetota bacterium]|nr:NAD-dependent epimerase/dehydratase family protein [Actinomycetota bacterium]